MNAAAYITASVLSAVLLGVAASCGIAAGGNHLSRWWLPSYLSLVMAFALAAEATVPGLAAS